MKTPSEFGNVNEQTEQHNAPIADLEAKSQGNPGDQVTPPGERGERESPAAPVDPGQAALTGAGRAQEQVGQPSVGGAESPAVAQYQVGDASPIPTPKPTTTNPAIIRSEWRVWRHNKTGKLIGSWRFITVQGKLTVPHLPVKRGVGKRGPDSKPRKRWAATPPPPILDIQEQAVLDAGARYRHDPIAFIAEILRGPGFRSQQMSLVEKLLGEGVGLKNIQEAVGEFDVWLRTGLWGKQVEMVRAVASERKVACRSANGTGKTFACADIVLWFLCTHTPSIVVTTAPTWRQVQKVLWGEIKNHFALSAVPLGLEVLGTEIRGGEKWYAIGFSSKKEANFQGFREDNILFVVDEALGVPRETFQAIEGSLSNINAKLFMVGNPTEDSGYFIESFSHESVKKVHIDALESPNVMLGRQLIPGLTSKLWCDERAVEWGEESAIYVSRVRGEIPRESSDTLIRLGWVEESRARWEEALGDLLPDKSRLTWDDVKDAPVPTTGLVGPVILGIDVARKGTNKTVLTVRQGCRVLEIKYGLGERTTWSFDQALVLMAKWGIAPQNVYVDTIGVGGGLGDMFYAKGMEVNEVEEIKAEENTRFANRRSELAWRVREAFRNGELDIPPLEELFFQCTHQYYDDLNGGKIMVMSKALLRKKQIESPDFFDSLALTYAGARTRRQVEQHSLYSNELAPAVHFLKMDQDDFNVGVLRYMYLVPRFDSPSVLVWAAADKMGRIFTYREVVVQRTSSTSIEDAIVSNEKMYERVYLRYVPHLYPQKDQINRFHLIEQLSASGLNFDEVNYNKDIACMNIREGLRYDQKKPLAGANLPYLFFDQTCVKIFRMLQSITDEGYTKVSAVDSALHEALGIMVLSEPKWFPRRG